MTTHSSAFTPRLVALNARKPDLVAVVAISIKALMFRSRPGMRRIDRILRKNNTAQHSTAQHNTAQIFMLTLILTVTHPPHILTPNLTRLFNLLCSVIPTGHVSLGLVVGSQFREGSWSVVVMVVVVVVVVRST
ncbi:hypothetical protein E2C01_072237 [Portunus trituberculatus]|uniref:Uncharacterized protein n=1 Tax=Portunus trituberculatus TaxID=210409 RepID=A0A5B7HXG3_PORTR|nr:hypothetical protein [Portunus trituberculatus]